jgi:hypothetical protein
MSLLDDINSQLALIPASGASASATIAYGSDLWCVDDLDDNCTELFEDDPRIISQALYRRFKTPRGALIDDSSYGLDVGSVLNKGLTQSDLYDAAAMIRNEALKDDRIVSCDVEVLQFSASTLQVTLSLVIADPEQSFTLVMACTDGELLLQEIRRAA